MAPGSVLVLIGLGSNLGDRRATLDGALAAMRGERGLEVLAASPWLETEPVGGPPGQPRYLNGAVSANCALPADELLALLMEIERRFGRDRRDEPRGGARTLDLDLLFFGDERIERDDLIVPHPRLEERVFVLEPLAHLVPERRLAGCGRTVRERLDELRVS